MKRIVIFASGSGTNAENIITYFNYTGGATVVLVLSNKRDAKVLDKSNFYKISSFSFNRIAFYENDDVLNLVAAAQPDLIVLAGFLWKFPNKILEKFPNKVINIHPALLPKYGGKGMYGMNVHEAVIKNNEKESGITIHYVNEAYDKGAVIFQAKTTINKNETAASLAAKIHELEYEHFPKIIEELLIDE